MKQTKFNPMDLKTKEDKLVDDIAFAAASHPDQEYYGSVIDESIDLYQKEDIQSLRKLLIKVKKEVMAIKKTPAKKPVVAKKAPVKKTVAKKAPAQKVLIEESEEVNQVVKKSPSKKVPAKKAPVKKAPAEKVEVKEAPEGSVSINGVEVVGGVASKIKGKVGEEPSKSAEQAVEKKLAKTPEEGVENNSSQTTVIDEDFMISCDGVSVGDKIDHKNNGVGEVISFKFYKPRGLFFPNVKFENKTRLISIQTAIKNLV